MFENSHFGDGDTDSDDMSSCGEKPKWPCEKKVIKGIKHLKENNFKKVFRSDWVRSWYAYHGVQVPSDLDQWKTAKDEMFKVMAKNFVLDFENASTSRLFKGDFVDTRWF